MSLTKMCEQITEGRNHHRCDKSKSHKCVKKAQHRRERQRVRQNIECQPLYRKYKGYYI